MHTVFTYGKLGNRHHMLYQGFAPAERVRGARRVRCGGPSPPVVGTLPAPGHTERGREASVNRAGKLIFTSEDMETPEKSSTVPRSFCSPRDGLQLARK
jgi:hypothetical protein